MEVITELITRFFGIKMGVQKRQTFIACIVNLTKGCPKKAHISNNSNEFE